MKLSRKSDQRNDKERQSITVLGKLRVMAFGAILVSAPFIFGVNQSYAATIAESAVKQVRLKENSDAAGKDKQSEVRLAASAKEVKQTRNLTETKQSAINKKQKAIADKRKNTEIREKAELEKKKAIDDRRKAEPEKKKAIDNRKAELEKKKAIDDRQKAVTDKRKAPQKK